MLLHPFLNALTASDRWPNRRLEAGRTVLGLVRKAAHLDPLRRQPYAPRIWIEGGGRLAKRPISNSQPGKRGPQRHIQRQNDSSCVSDFCHMWHQTACRTNCSIQKNGKFFLMPTRNKPRAKVRPVCLGRCNDSTAPLVQQNLRVSFSSANLSEIWSVRGFAARQPHRSDRTIISTSCHGRHLR